MAGSGWACGEGSRRGGTSHVGWKRLDRPGMLTRASAKARALGLGMLPLAASVVLLGLAAASDPQPAAAAQGGARGDVPVIYQKQRSFRIPFNLSAAQKDRIKEVILLVSEDSFTWEPRSRTDASHPAFSFRAAHDGEYWFTVQTRTMDGKVSPSLDTTVEPKMKVIIDTMPPSLLLVPDKRRGSAASVRWEAKDEYLALRSMLLEYQVEGVGVWNRVPIRSPRRIGAQKWDAGTAEALRVRMSVADEAGNVTTVELTLPDGTGTPPEADPSPGDELGAGAPRIEPISSPGPAQTRIVAGEGFTPVGEDPPPSRPAPPPRSAPTTSRPRPATGSKGRTRPTPPDIERDPGLPPAGSERATLAASTAGRNRERSAGPDLFRTANPGPSADGGLGAAPPEAASGPSASTAGGPPRGSAAPAAAGGNAPNAGNTLLVDSPRFKLQYAVDDAGPNGPATVELWITQDGGRTWIRRGEDPDHASPIDVDLGGEGTYGIWLVARSAAGLGDQPPAPGDPPQSWVEVDASAPAVQLDPVQVGTGVNTGKIAITWRATDLHLAPKSVSILWRPDAPGTSWQPVAEGQENAGRYIWTVPQSVPARFHIRVEAADSVGHRGSAESTDSGPIMVDRSRPRSRIIGLDPNARSGTGPSAWPLR